MTDVRTSLYLVDGSAYIFRAFHALPNLTNSRGESIGAVHGVVRMLLALEKEKRPTYLAVCFDAKGPTFRDEMYPAYKAQRPEIAEEIRMQIPWVHEATELIGLPTLKLEGFEADDIIATLAHQYADVVDDVVVVSGDKDLMQLVDDRRCITMVDPMKAATYDEAGVTAKWGVPPTKVRDLLAIMGDSSDNFPGVKGIGQKGAATLLQQFDSLADIYARIDEVVSKSHREKLLASRENADMSYRLAGLALDVPLDIGLDALKVKKPDAARADAFFEHLGVKTIRKEVAALAAEMSSDSGVSNSTALEAPAPSKPVAPVAFGHAPTTQPQATTPVSAPVAPKREFQGIQGQGNLFGDATPTSGVPQSAPYVAGHTASDTSDEDDDTADTTHRHPSGSPRRTLDYRPVVVDTVEALESLVAKLMQTKRFAFDLETTGLEVGGAQIVGVALAMQLDEGFYIPLRHDHSTNIEPAVALQILQPLFDNPAIQKVGQNLKYDCSVFDNNGMDVQFVAGDSLLAHALLWPEAQIHGLDRMADQFLGHTMIAFGDVTGDDKRFAAVPVDRAANYAAEDAIAALALLDKFEPELDRQGLRTVYEKLEVPLLPVLARMEATGVRVDRQQLQTLGDKIRADLVTVQEQIIEAAGETFNLNSTQQLSHIMFDKLKYPTKGVRKTKAGAYSTRSEVLDDLADEGYELPQKILHYRKLEKLRSTYVETLPLSISPATGRIHPTFHQIGAATGRLSCTDPNLQNIPIRDELGRQIRAAFVPADGYRLLSMDYSQIELRLLAHFSQDASMVEAFVQDRDIHAQTAAQVLGIAQSDVTPDQRRHAKAVNFGLMYGMGAQRMSKSQGMTMNEAKQYIERYFAQFPSIQEFLKGVVNEARDRGYAETIAGRKRWLPDLLSTDRRFVAQAERIATNTPIQGSAADIVKLAMLAVDQLIAPHRDEVRMLLQVHDELVFEVAHDRVEYWTPLIRSTMEGVVSLRVPLRVDGGAADSWAEAHG